MMAHPEERVQRALMKCWKVIQSHALISGLLLAVLVIVLLVVPAYLFHWDWTGFTAGASQIEIAPAKAGGYKVAVSQPGKSLWDWLGLLGTLAIPVVDTPAAVVTGTADRKNHGGSLSIHFNRPKFLRGGRPKACRKPPGLPRQPGRNPQIRL